MDLLKGLNQQQKKAAQHAEGPLLVVAGAGTGKTKVITRRIAYLAEKKVPAEKILAVTFTNKAADEMRSRIADLIGTGLGAKPKPTIGTFHSIASDILRKYGKNIGISANFSIADERQAMEIIKSSIGELGLNLRQFRPNFIQNAISKEKSNSFQKANLEREPKPEDSFFAKNLNLIAQRYCERLKEKNSPDFDDLI